MNNSSDKILALLDKNEKNSHSLIFDLSDEQLDVACLPTINLPLWELAHVFYFYEQKVLGQIQNGNSFLKGSHDLFDSIEIGHPHRWNLKLPSRDRVKKYGESVRELLRECLKEGRELNERAILFALYHEQMHQEAFLYTRQTLGYSNPLSFILNPSKNLPQEFIEISGGEYFVGTGSSQNFVFDNERWGRLSEFRPFEISKYPVTYGQYLEFVKDKGFENENFWKGPGLIWLKSQNRKEPLYWQNRGGEYYVKNFDSWLKISDHLSHPCLFINWYEAKAYCEWAGERLPTEWEWQLASSIEKPSKSPGLRVKCWEGTDINVNLLGQNNQLCSVDDFTQGESYFGCKQMLGNTWEWTDSTHLPLDGYRLDEVYAEYSVTSFGYHKVLKGGSWASGSDFISNNFRNFYLPHRSDVFAGFRTCKI